MSLRYGRIVPIAPDEHQWLQGREVRVEIRKDGTYADDLPPVLEGWVSRVVFPRGTPQILRAVVDIETSVPGSTAPIELTWDLTTRGSLLREPFSETASPIVRWEPWHRRCAARISIGDPRSEKPPRSTLPKVLRDPFPLEKIPWAYYDWNDPPEEDGLFIPYYFFPISNSEDSRQFVREGSPVVLGDLFQGTEGVLVRDMGGTVAARVFWELELEIGLVELVETEQPDHNGRLRVQASERPKQFNFHSPPLAAGMYVDIIDGTSQVAVGVLAGRADEWWATPLWNPQSELPFEQLTEETRDSRFIRPGHGFLTHGDQP